MSLLKSEPAGSVKSLEELFVIAAVMEQEAATRSGPDSLGTPGNF